VPRTGISKWCFICLSPQHLANMCPQRSGSQAYKSGQKPFVNACLTKPKGKKMIEYAQRETDTPKFTPRGNSVTHQVKDGNVNVSDVEPAVHKVTVDDRGDDVIVDDSYRAKECFSDSDNNSVVNNAEEGPYDPLLADGWSQLRFVDVNIDGLPYEVTALNDSGCQLCVIKAEVVKSHLPAEFIVTLDKRAVNKITCCIRPIFMLLFRETRTL